MYKAIPTCEYDQNSSGSSLFPHSYHPSTDMKWKREADLDLHRRKALQYTIIRPGGLVDEPTNGKCELGTPQLGKVVSLSSISTEIYSTNFLESSF